ncbi:MAG: fumarylacetoacetate hydrolase family protein [Myxococcales bacterium]|nr:fumarylacetoacetate hydrolase family protein [Myxococcales bacterium]
MRFFRVSTPGGPTWARDLDGSDLLELIDAAPWDSPRPTGARVALADVALLAPAAPSKIVCVGRNYRAHAAELGNDVPSEPLLFLKPPSALLGHGGTIQLPPESQRVEHEAELAVVLGARLRDARDLAEVRAAVLGLTIANDVTARDLQRRDVQFTRAKGFDTFCPLGPYVRTDLEPDDLAIELRVNGAVRQASRTSAMVFPTLELVATISRIMTLEPGDVVLTGTPEGVGPLAAGDEVEVSIEGLGVLRSGVAARVREA